MVDPEICRFDFTHFSAVTPEQLAEVEAIVNKRILAALPVKIQEMTIEEAKKLHAMALFGDKYGDIVRVCDISGKSVELCGGTHVANTAEIGLFKLLSEGSAAAGIRRIEATTGAGVLRFIENQNELLLKACEALKASGPAELPAKAQAAAAQIRELQKQVQELNDKMADIELAEATREQIAIGPVQFTAVGMTGVSVDAMRSAADRLRDRLPEIVGLFGTTSDDKATFLVFAGKKAVEAGIHCGKLVKELSQLAGGSGGGRPDSAMGGSPDIEKAVTASAKLPELIKKMLNI
jgi:alanyl-tRNA synthetase